MFTTRIKLARSLTFLMHETCQVWKQQHAVNLTVAQKLYKSKYASRDISRYSVILFSLPSLTLSRNYSFRHRHKHKACKLPGKCKNCVKLLKDKRQQTHPPNFNKRKCFRSDSFCEDVKIYDNIICPHEFIVLSFL